MKFDEALIRISSMQESVSTTSSSIPSNSGTNSSAVAPIKLMTLNVPLIHQQTSSLPTPHVPGPRVIRMTKINTPNGPINIDLGQLPGMGTFLMQTSDGNFQVINLANSNALTLPSAQSLSAVQLQNQGKSQKLIFHIAQPKQGNVSQTLTSSTSNRQHIARKDPVESLTSNPQLKLQQPAVMKTVKLNPNCISRENPSTVSNGNMFQVLQLKNQKPSPISSSSTCSNPKIVQVFKNISSVPLTRQTNGTTFTPLHCVTSPSTIPVSQQNKTLQNDKNCVKLLSISVPENSKSNNSLIHPNSISSPENFSEVFAMQNNKNNQIVNGCNVTPLGMAKEISKPNGTIIRLNQSTNEPRVKCSSFLNNLIKLASQQPIKIKNTVIALIQTLIDNKISPDDFVSNLEKCLSSAPQPSLAPFLKISLPPVRQAMISGRVVLEGIRPPLISALVTSDPKTATPKDLQIMKVQIEPRFESHTQIQMIAQPSVAFPNISQNSPWTKNSRSPLQLAYAQNQVPTLQNFAPRKQGVVVIDNHDAGITTTHINSVEDKTKLLQFESTLSQTKSLIESFLCMDKLQNWISVIAQKYNLCISENVAEIISTAVKKRLLDLMEKTTVAVAHRMDDMRFNSQYQISQDIKGQFRFLADLDKIEKKRYEEAEQQLLTWAAKTRSNLSQTDLKERAKEWQRSRSEQSLFADANNTALLAIGARKKQKTDMGSYSLLNRPRIKRVTVKDLLFVLEREKTTDKNWLYKVYLK